MNEHSNVQHKLLTMLCKCGSGKISFLVEPTGPHRGRATCSECGRWVKWLSIAECEVIKKLEVKNHGKKI